MDDGPLQRSVSRRELLRIGGLAGLISPFAAIGGTTSDATRLPGFGRAKSVIVVYANGGQSQLETWDPKPHAPAAIRGEFAAIPTSVPGTLISEHFPRLAQMADRYAIIRSMSHDDLDHGSATYLSLTGRFHTRKSSNPLPTPDDAPALGAVLTRVRPTTEFPYSAVHINGPAFVPLIAGPGQYGGVLGRDYDPLVLGDVNEAAVGPAGLSRQPGLPTVRLDARRTLLQSLDEFVQQRDRGALVGDVDGLYSQAYEMLASPACRDAFDLTQEDDQLRDRYGRNRAGQACLLARRLVEAEVPWVTVFFNHNARGQDVDPKETDLYGWDTHNDIFVAMKNYLMPRFDLGFSALLEDLENRGLLETTLVVCMGEFGRAPTIAIEKAFAGESPGRKHWASVYSIVLAGAGVQPGLVYGASDEIAAYPLENMTTPADVTATMFAALGIDPASHYHDGFGRPFVISEGRPISGLY
ncbi:MAG: DUF1501 domain-containing protein [Planctomycetaceae bacterium]|nr:DUF1501 domain-containing protein [Planctomycetaceae bacterium]